MSKQRNSLDPSLHQDRVPVAGDPQGMRKAPDSQNTAQKLFAPGLYVIATPIGNARDITLRALDVLKVCDAIMAEDTRVTSKLLAIYGISKPLFPYNDHNAAQARPRLLARLRGGERVALVSDAGTQAISSSAKQLPKGLPFTRSLAPRPPSPPSWWPVCRRTGSCLQDSFRRKAANAARLSRN